MLRCFSQQDRERILDLPYRAVQLDVRGLYLMQGSPHLYDRCLCGHTRLFHRLHHTDILLIDTYGLCRNIYLAIQHQQGEVGVGYAADQLRTNRLTAILTLEVGRPLPTRGVQQLAEQVDLPAGRTRNTVGLCGVGPIVAIQFALPRDVDGGQIGQTSGGQQSLRLLHTQDSRLHIHIVRQSLLDQSL